jgi:hypothetical protein
MAKAKPPIPAIKPVRSTRAAAPTARGTESVSSKKSPKPRAARPKTQLLAVPKAPKPNAPKTERGRFTLPAADFARIAALKQRARDLGRPTKKNELFRVGLAMLSALPDEALVIALDQLEPIGKKARRKQPKSDLDNRDW